METKKYPSFHKNLFIKIVLAILVSGALFLNTYFFEGKNFLAGDLGIILMGIIIFSVIAYGFWASNHIKCPKCSSLCEKYSDELNKNRKVICKKCEIVWDLGVSYNTDSGG